MTNLVKRGVSSLMLSAILIAGLGHANAQKLTASIPADATIVTILNGDQMASKIDFKKMVQLEMIQKGLEEMQADNPENAELVRSMLDHPANIGLDMMRPVYFYDVITEEGKSHSMALLFHLSDSKKFTNTVQTVIKKSQNGEEIKKIAGAQYVQTDEAVTIWKGDIAAIKFEYSPETSGMEESIYPDDETTEEEMQQKIEELARMDEVKKLEKKARMLKDAQLAVNGIGVKSITSNANFVKFDAQKFDFGIWVDNKSAIKNSGSSSGMDNFSLNMYNQIMMSIYGTEDEYTWWTNYTLNFDNGAIKTHGTQMVTGPLAKRLDATYLQKINPKYTSYIPSKNFMGMGGFALDFKPLLGDLYDSYLPLLQQSMQGSGSLPPVIQEFMDNVVFQKDALFGLLINGGFVSVNGFEQKEVTYMTYEYDDDGYQKEVEKTKKQILPIVTAFFTSGNVAETNKLIEATVALGYLTKAEVENTYTFTVPEYNTQATVLLRDDLIIVTNNAAVISASAKGLKSKDQITSSLREDLKNRNIFFHFDMQAILDYVKNDSETPAEMTDFITAMMATLKSIESKDDNSLKSGQYESKLNIHMQNTDRNSFEQLMNLANKIYILSQN